MNRNMAPQNESVLSLGDVELTEKLRREDPDQYLTLVRMHLSFVLDLSTEDCDTVSGKPKFRPLKWSLAPFSKKSKPAFRGVMEGAPLTQEGICQVYQLIEFLSIEANIVQEGVFRRSGKMTRQQELKTLLNQGASLNLGDGRFSVHDCASVLKNFLAELPEPLLTDAHYQAHCQIAEMCAGDITTGDQASRLLRALQLLLLLLPTENRLLLEDVLKLLHRAASFESSNKMSADNLATLFTPHLLCPRKIAPEELHISSQVMARVVSFMIRQGASLFDVPPKLATDIRAYLMEKERTKESQMSNAVEDHVAANTVFSFVDRQLTAQANSVNPTEAALANLYAHIQSLPESAQKRRLVKQFNKENGHGTPLYVKNQGTTRSLGDSIKKHIFTKGLKRHKAQQNTSTDDNLKVSSNSSPPKERFSAAASTPLAEMSGTSHFTLARPQVTKRRIAMEVNEVGTVRLSPGEHVSPPSTPNNALAISSPAALLDSTPLRVELTPLKALTPCEIILTTPSGTETNSSTPPFESDSAHGRITPNERFEAPPEDEASSKETPSAERQGLASWNSLQPMTSTPAPPSSFSPTLNNEPPCFSLPCTPRCPDGTNKSMSPITRSTRKMSRAMQETMMTPRSRKPVLVLSSSNLSQYGSWGQSSMVGDLSSNPTKVVNPEDSLTSTFRDYLISRSVLTASPVSLSENPSPEKLSDSLLFCLDGNEPNSSSCASTLSQVSDTSSRKRSADSLFEEQSVSMSSESGKKSTYDSSMLGSSSGVHETSL